jgi:hypothetical protein
MVLIPNKKPLERYYETRGLVKLAGNLLVMTILSGLSMFHSELQILRSLTLFST